MLPRIYVYKITFVDQPYWYWGIHKEKRFNEYYMGSPCTNKHYWELYEPKKEIIQVFDYSGEGWSQAREVEINLIKLDLNNPLCLNAAYGCIPSLSILTKRWEDLEQRKAQSQRMREKWNDNEFRNILLKHSFKQKWQNPDFRSKMSNLLSQNLRQKWEDEEYRNKMSIERKLKWEDEEYRNKILKKRGNPVTILEIETGKITEFASLNRAKIFYKIGYKTLSKLISGVIPEYKGLKVLQISVN
jgi:hypothetical protein